MNTRKFHLPGEAALLIVLLISMERKKKVKIDA